MTQPTFAVFLGIASDVFRENFDSSTNPLRKNSKVKDKDLEKKMANVFKKNIHDPYQQDASKRGRIFLANKRVKMLEEPKEAERKDQELLKNSDVELPKAFKEDRMRAFHEKRKAWQTARSKLRDEKDLLMKPEGYSYSLHDREGYDSENDESFHLEYDESYKSDSDGYCSEKDERDSGVFSDSKSQDASYTDEYCSSSRESSDESDSLSFHSEDVENDFDTTESEYESLNEYDSDRSECIRDDEELGLSDDDSNEELFGDRENSFPGFEFGSRSLEDEVFQQRVRHRKFVSKSIGWY